jgi:hypothetical protein
MQAAYRILLAVVPALVMIGLITALNNETLVAGLFVLIIAVSLWLRYERHDSVVLLAGLLLYPIAEYLFVSSGVETFTERGLFGIMPLWMPFLWAWGSVAIKRVVMVLDLLFNKSSIW